MNIKNLKNKEKGITLIALVVTIVVLLILASVTINLVLSDNGIVEKAQDARDNWERAEQEEEEALQELVNEFDEMLNNGEDESQNLSDLVNKVASTTENVTAKDENGNTIVIPANFKVVPNGVSGVTYSYNGDSTKPCVQDGIVIENATDGNQFVWVPIGTIKNQNSSETIIELGRYTFESDGTPHKAQGAIDSYYIEESNSSYGNTPALDLTEWMSKATSNKGYYIARYEAGKEGDKAASKQTVSVTSATGVTISDNGMLWNNITQSDASRAAKAMYPTTGTYRSKYYSDLVNSYAWDTAIVFIQEYSGYKSYSQQNGMTFSNSLQNTGTNGDKVCNIYDMASNASEWTTESHTNSGPCTFRGGCYYIRDNVYTSSRDCQDSSYSGTISFRTVICVK